MYFTDAELQLIASELEMVKEACEIGGNRQEEVELIDNIATKIYREQLQRKNRRERPRRSKWDRFRLKA